MLIHLKKQCLKQVKNKDKKEDNNRVNIKKTTSQIIRDKKIKQPSRLINFLFRILIKFVYNAPCKAEYIRHIDPRKYKNKPVIIVVNHASRFDFAFVQGAMGKRRINFVAAEEEFHRTKFKTVLRWEKIFLKKVLFPILP